MIIRKLDDPLYEEVRYYNNGKQEYVKRKLKCIRCDIEIRTSDKLLMNKDKEIAHDSCIGFDDLDENWVECKYIG